MHDTKSLKSVDPASGALFWEHPNGTEVLVPSLQPHVIDDQQVLLPAEEGLALLRVSRTDGRWAVDEIWNSNRLKPIFNDVAVFEQAIYGLDDGIGCCLDLKTGARHWKKGRFGHGQLLLLPEQQALLVVEEYGDIVLLAARPDRFEELGRMPGIAGKTWNHPVIAHDRLYVRNGEEMACFDLSPAESVEVAEASE